MCYWVGPYLQLHEYRTMLFADPAAFEPEFEDCAAQVVALQSIADDFAHIEHINDSSETAPSKRIIQVFPAYEGRKASAGPDIAKRIGLATIREKCAHLDQWLRKLENLHHGEP